MLLIPKNGGEYAELQYFSAQVKRTAEKYDICVQHRFLMIRTCCERLTELMSGKNIRQNHSKEDAEKLQELLELLICAISDTGVLFHEIGVWHDLPNEWGWENSEKASRKITDAVRYRNFAYYTLVGIRRHLDEHKRQDRAYEANQSSESVFNKINKIYDELKMVDSKFEKNEKEWRRKIADAEAVISQERVLLEMAPLCFFLMVVKDVKKDDLRKALKHTNQSYKTPVEDFRCYAAIERGFQEGGNKRLSLIFDPVAFLYFLREKYNLRMDPKRLGELADLCFYCIEEPNRKNEFQKFTEEVNGVPVGEVMKAVLVQIHGQPYNGAIKGHKMPREYNESIATLRRACLIMPDLSEYDDLTIGKEDGKKLLGMYQHLHPQKYAHFKEILRVVQEKMIEKDDLGGKDCKELHNDVAEEADKKKFDTLFPYKPVFGLKNSLRVEEYDFSQEAFWIVTQYAIPADINYNNRDDAFAHEKNGMIWDEKELYAIIDKMIRENWQGIYERVVPEYVRRREFAGTAELQKGISKIRCEMYGFSEEIEKGFLKVITESKEIWDGEETYDEEEIYNKLKKYCTHIYKTNKTNYTIPNKIKLYEDSLADAMVDEMFLKIGAEIQEEVIGVLVLLTKCVWSITDPDYSKRKTRGE